MLSKGSKNLGQELADRSEEVQEILGHIPRWTIRWGTIVFVLIIALLCFFGWFIKFPSTIKVEVVLTTRIPASIVKAKTDGYLQPLVNENAPVRRGDYLAMVKSPVSLQSVNDLEKYVTKFTDVFNNKNKDFTAVNLPNISTLGELQPAFTNFRSKLLEFSGKRALLSNDESMSGITSQIYHFKKLIDQALKQQKILSDELQISQKRLEDDNQLFDKGNLSELELEKSENTVFQIQRNYALTQNIVINNQIILANLTAQRNQLLTTQEYIDGKLKREVEASFKELRNQLASWKLQHLLQTPVDGVVAFINNRKSNQYVQSGEEVLSVSSNKQTFYCEAQIPASGSEKVSVGQFVNIRFDDYPATEYGIVKGKITEVSSFSSGGQYTIKVNLIHGLNTTYHRKLPFRHEMQGDAEIIVEDLRLIQRIFNQFRSLIYKVKLPLNAQF